MLTRFISRMICASVFCLIAIPSARADSNSADSLKNAIARLEARIAQLETELHLQTAEANPAVLNPDNMIAGRGGLVYLPPRDNSLAANEKPMLERPISIESADLSISGFMDGVYDVNLDKQSENQAALNQVELDIAKALGPKAEIGLSLCYDEAIVIGAATISYSPYSRDIFDGDRIPAVRAWTLTAGQFDAPFGLDYAYYCSADRSCVTQPEIVCATHDSWNDVGLWSTLDTRWATVDMYCVKGFESRVWTGEEPIGENLGDDDERWSYSAPQVSGGLRVNTALIPDVECGFSLARGWQTDRRPEMSLLGAHAQMKYRDFALKGEGIRLRKAESVQLVTVEGWYAEGMQSIGKLFVLARRDVVNDDETGVERYIGAGGGVRILDNLECRVEYRTDDYGANRRLLTQVVARF